jgi:hypothetical protein
MDKSPIFSSIFAVTSPPSPSAADDVSLLLGAGNGLLYAGAGLPRELGGPDPANANDPHDLITELKSATIWRMPWPLFWIVVVAWFFVIVFFALWFTSLLMSNNTPMAPRAEAAPIATLVPAIVTPERELLPEFKRYYARERYRAQLARPVVARMAATPPQPRFYHKNWHSHRSSVAAEPTQLRRREPGQSEPQYFPCPASVPC